MVQRILLKMHLFSQKRENVSGEKMCTSPEAELRKLQTGIRMALRCL